MTEQEFSSDIARFLGKHPLGQELKRRWEHRVQQLTHQLVYEADEPTKILLQAKIQYHREVTREIGI